jgi:Transcriptional regulatory protein, C terminal
MEPLRHTLVVRFGTFEVSLHSGELRKAGLRIRVQQQPLKLLEVLLEHPGEVITREELRSRVWPNESLVISTRQSTLQSRSSGARWGTRLRTRDSRIEHGNLAGIECRYREHLIESDGFRHRVHHALKTALQFLIPGTVHHSYDVVIVG